MKKIKFGANFTVFILFFGIALLEVIQAGNFISALCWIAIGIVFLAADNLKKNEE